MQSDSELSSDSESDSPPSSENGPMTDRVNKIVHPSEYASSSDESETSLIDDEEEETDNMSTDDDDETPIADKYKNLKYKLTDTRIKMKNLVENIEEYKNFLEKEKEDIQASNSAKIAKAQEEREEALKRFEESMQIQQQMEQQYQDMVREFNGKLEALQEEKKARVKENVENLQTLIKELTYIEESNQTLNEQLDKEREDHLATKEQLKLHSQLVAQLELKLKQQQSNAPTNTNTSVSSGNNGDTEDLKKQLQAEKSRADQVTMMLTQIRQILFTSGGSEINGESTLLSKLQEEQESHKITRTTLDEEQKKRKQNEKTIEKLNKRIKDLIHTHSNTLREISVPAPPAAEEPPVVVAAKTDKTSTSSSPNNTITSKSKKKESENLTLEEKIQRMFLCVDTDRVEELSKLLKKTRGLIVATDNTGRSVLHKAALNGSSLQMVKLLLENGIEPNYQDINGWNVLHCAAKCPIDNSDVFKYLLKKQEIRADMVNNDGNLPIHFYARSKVINTEVLNILIHKTANINATNYIGETPLHCACLSAQESAIQLLLKGGANPNAQNSKGESPLHVASRVGNLKVIMSLLEHGGDPNLKGDEGTPIDVAAPIDSVKSLLTNPIQSTLSLKDRKKTLASTVPTIEAAQDTPRSRNSTVVQEPKLMITVLCPELSISVQVPLEINIQVKDALTAIRKKIPGKHPNFMLYSTAQKLPENRRLAEFPEIAETLQLYYQHKDNPLMQAKNRTSTMHPGKLSLANHTLSSPSLIRRFSMSMDSNRLLAPNGDNRRSSADTLVGSKGQQQQVKDEKHVKIAQRVIRRWLARKRYKELLALSNNRKFTVHDIYQSEYEHVRSLETMFQNWVTPIIESSVLPIQTKESLSELFHFYEAIITVTKNLVNALKPFTVHWNHHALIGKLFLTLDPPLSAYSEYAKSFQLLFPTIHEKAFSALLLKIPAMNEQIANSIDVWLDVPIVHIQRLKKHVLRLHKDTSIEHKDFEYIGQLLVLIDAIQTDCERAHKSRKNLEMLLQIESRFVGNHPFLKLPDRMFVREGPLQRNYRLTSRSRHVILFSDILLFTEPISKSNQYKYLEQIELNGHYEVKEYNDRANKGFVLVSPSNKDPIILTASTAEEKQQWIKSLSQVIHDLKETIQIPKSSASTSDIKVKMSSLLNSGALSTSPTGSPLTSPSPVPSKGLRFLSRTTSVVAPKKIPEKYQNATSVIQMVDVMHQDACYICLNKFGVTKRKYVCKTCSNAMCKSCKSVKNDKLCKNCAEGKSKVMITTFSDLPDKIVCKICFYLDISQVPKTLMTCKRMYKLGANPQFWKKLHRITFNYSILGDSRRLSSSNYTVSDPNPIDWKSKCITQNNWEKGRYCVSTIKGHGSAISTLRFSGNIMISGSMDTTAKVWNLNSGECIATLKGHLSTVKFVDIIPDRNLLLSVSDSYLKVWNTSSAKLLHSLKLYSSDISAMHYDPDTNCVVTASEKTIKFVSLNDYEVTKTLTDKSKIYSAFMRKDMLITGTNNGIKLWDLSQDKQINSLKGHSDIVRCVAFDTNTIVSGSEDNTIKLYNQQKEYTLTGHKGKIQSLQFDKNKVVSGSTDGTIKIWSVRNKNCLYTLKQPEADSGWVRCLQYSENILLSGHGDSVIRMWDFTPK